MTEQGKSQRRIREAEVKIRDYLTLDTRIRRRYTRNRRSWNIVVAALDALGDSELALAAYLNGRPSSDGEAYLRLYGALQAVIVEQDAISHLMDELSKKGTASSLLDRRKFKAIRRLRIKVAGHPVLTKDGRKPPLEPDASHQIARYAVRGGGVVLLTSSANEPAINHDINLPALILDQRRTVAEAIEGLLAQFRAETAAHRVKYRGEKLADIFTDGDIGSVRRQLAALKVALARRSTPLKTHYDFVAMYVKDVEDALARGASPRDVEPLMAKVRECAKNIDETYASEPD